MTVRAFCSSCGEQLESTAQFCSVCGTEQSPFAAAAEAIQAPPPTVDVSEAEPPGLPSCPECDAEFGTDARFCEECGTPRPNEPTAEMPALVEASDQRASQPAASQALVTPRSDAPETELPLYRPAAYPAARNAGNSTPHAAGKALGGFFAGLGGALGVIVRVGFVVVWGAAAVALLVAGQVLAALGCAAYAVYLACGGRWFIW